MARKSRKNIPEVVSSATVQTTIFAIFQDKKTADNALKSLRSIEDIKQAYVVRPIR